VKNACGILQGRSHVGGEAGPTAFSAENDGWMGTELFRCNKKGSQEGVGTA